MPKSGRVKVQLISPSLLRRWPLPQISAEADKEAKGRVLVIAGAPELPGAAVLSSVAALRAGAGKVRVVVPGSIAPFVGVAAPELYVLAFSKTGRRSVALLESISKATAVLVGPGSPDPAMLRFLIPRILAEPTLRSVVLDSSAMLLASKILERKPDDRVILTPHRSEMARLLGVSREIVDKDPLAIGREASIRWGCTIILKGSDTLISSPSGTLYLHKGSQPGLGTAGSGDVLSGIVAGLCTLAPPLQAAVWAVTAHARAGKRLARKIAPAGYLAREILQEIPPSLF